VSRGVFQVERVLEGASFRVTGRVIEGSITIGDTLSLQGSDEAAYEAAQIDVFGRSVREVTAGTVAALALVPRVAAPLARGARLVKVSG
jgi:selenocysteine-specific translation elongation factor